MNAIAMIVNAVIKITITETVNSVLSVANEDNWIIVHDQLFDMMPELHGSLLEKSDADAVSEIVVNPGYTTFTQKKSTEELRSKRIHTNRKKAGNDWHSSHGRRKGGNWNAEFGEGDDLQWDSPTWMWADKADKHIHKNEIDPDWFYDECSIPVEIIAARMGASLELLNDVRRKIIMHIVSKRNFVVDQRHERNLAYRIKNLVSESNHRSNYYETLEECESVKFMANENIREESRYIAMYKSDLRQINELRKELKENLDHLCESTNLSSNVYKLIFEIVSHAPEFHATEATYCIKWISTLLL